MHDGQTGAMVALEELLPDDSLFAVGALSGLEGEVTIVGGRAYLSYPEGGGVRTVVQTESTASATLLVATWVERWESTVIAEPIPFEQLDARVVELARKAGLDPDERFPFLLMGEFEDLHWHVIDGRRLPATGASHTEHRKAAAVQHAERVTATLVGFYSATDEGIFTHRGSRTHVHCIVEEPLSSGHVDGAVVPARTTIRFPVPER
jgi:acetolactate decarboxylase